MLFHFSWSEELAQIAQRWADQCIFDHDEMSARATEKFAHVGQNVYLQKISKKVPGIPFKGVKKWFDEIKKFDAQQISPFAFTYKTGHFTQIAWATTTEVSAFKEFYFTFISSLNLFYRLVVDGPISWMDQDGKEFLFAIMDLEVMSLANQCMKKEIHALNVHLKILVKNLYVHNYSSKRKIVYSWFAQNMNE